MAYDVPIKWKNENSYGSDLHDYELSDVYTVKGFLEFCECGAFIDYDGYGHPAICIDNTGHVQEGLSDRMIDVRPSKLDRIPSDATHIVWFNR